MTKATTKILELLERIADGIDAGRAEGLAPADAAALLGISTSKLHELNARGLMPAPSELGDRCPRWSRTELKTWLLAGAPGRARWNLMRDTTMRRTG